ncbi:hypothetical protein BT69DRAFT_1287143 [Atractiella rhizophila]|nr:hypothetical protein BT69DRAFT_1287143 [Atractiella rhizophila]
MANQEKAPLLPPPTSSATPNRRSRTRLLALLSVLVVVVYLLPHYLPHLLTGSQKQLTAKELLDKYPLIDGHIDLPIFARWKYGLQTGNMDLRKTGEEGVGGHVDIPKLREGGVGGFFWSVYADCPPDQAGNSSVTNSDLLLPNDRVRDTLEQIDVALQLIAQYPDSFSLALTSSDIKKSQKEGKIASLLGIEGGHQLGNSLATLRTFYTLGVRYVTLTHGCHNAFADSCGYTYPFPGLNGGISAFGRTLIEEMNRLGMIIDISHTSPETASQALTLSKAPTIFSHSSSRYVNDHPRNVPDSILARLGQYSKYRVEKPSDDRKGGNAWGMGEEETKDIPAKDGIVMVNFAPGFVGPDADVSLVADHVDRIGLIAGKDHVGVGSDYDGIDSTPTGLEDVSKYPALVEELVKRGWTESEIEGFTRGNLIRVLEGVEKVKAALKGESPRTEIWSERKDL